jgi:hypothetical protein
MYLQQDNQHAGQPDRNALLLLRCAYRFLTLSLMVNAPPCPPISVQSHTGKTTREVMSERPDHRDGDALVHEPHQGAMYGRQVCYNISLVPYIYTFLPCPTFRRTQAHHPSPFHPQPLHASSHAASHLRRPVRITLEPAHLQKGDYLALLVTSLRHLQHPTHVLHIPQTQSATNTHPRDIACYPKTLVE